MTQEINHMISAIAAIIAIIMAIIVIVRSFHRGQLERRISANASKAIRLASLAIKRVEASRLSRTSNLK